MKPYNEIIDKYIPKKGDAFICAKDDYNNINMHIAFLKDNKDLYSIYYSRPENGAPSQKVETALTNLTGPFFPSFLGYLIRGKTSKDLKFQLDLYRYTINKLDGFLKTYNSLLISDAISKIIDNSQYTPFEVSMALRVLIAEAISYKIKKLESGIYISFSDLKSSSERSKQYYGSLAEEIALKSKQISLLISHGQTIGNYRELILRSLLEKYLPSKFSVVTGFIEGVARQLDILIIDSQNYSPVFKEGDLVVARKESVRAIIEVKTTLDSQKLDESLDLFYDIFRGGLFKPNIPIFKGVFAFETNYSTTNKLSNRIKDFYTKPYFEDQLQYEITREIQYLYHEITCVCVLKKHFVYSDYENFNGESENNIVPTLKSVSDENGLDVQSAMFIASLFRYLDVDFVAKKSTLHSFNDLLNTNSVKIKHEAYLSEKDWIPRLSSTNEHDYTQESIKNRLSNIKQWFNGETSSAEYIKKFR